MNYKMYIVAAAIIPLMYACSTPDYIIRKEETVIVKDGRLEHIIKIYEMKKLVPVEKKIDP